MHGVRSRHPARVALPFALKRSLALLRGGDAR